MKPDGLQLESYSLYINRYLMGLKSLQLFNKLHRECNLFLIYYEPHHYNDNQRDHPMMDHKD
jgi:hypothetical protein